MANVKAYEKSNSFRFDVDLGIVNKPQKRYEFSKTAPQGQTQEQYLQACKREAILLAEHETAEKNDEYIEIIV